MGALNEGFSPEHIEYTSADPELREPFVAELILSGALDEMTTKLMWRLAARCAGREASSEVIAVEKRKFFHRVGIEPKQLAHWLEKLGRDSEWLNEMLAVEAVYRTHCDALLVPEARQRELMAQRLHLTRFEVERIELESYDAAKEALFCVREDGMSMEEIATEGRYPYPTYGLSSGRASGGRAADIFKRLSRGAIGPDAAWRRIRTLSHYTKS